MLQYAANDSKLVIYIFLLMVGLFFHLKKIKEFDRFDYFENLKIRFIEGKESLEKIKNKKSNEFELQYVFIKTIEECLNIIRLKLEDRIFFNQIIIK